MRRLLILLFFAPGLLAWAVSKPVVRTDISGGISVFTYGARGNGTHDDRPNLVAMETATGDNNRWYFLPGDYKIGDDYTAQSTRTLAFSNGAKLVPASGKTVTVLSGIDAGLYQIFDTSAGGDIDLTGNSKVTKIYPQWWGAKGNGSNDDTSALQAAINASHASSIPVVLPKGTYIFSNTLYLDSNVTIRAEGSSGNAILKLKNSSLVPSQGALIQGWVTNTAISNITLDGITIDGNGANNNPIGYAMIFRATTGVSVVNCTIHNITGGPNGGGSYTSGGGIDFAGLSVGGTMTYNTAARITGNHLYDFGTTADDRADMIYYGGSEAVIANNILIGATDTAIVWEAQSTDAAKPDHEVVIANNVIRGNAVQNPDGTVTGNGQGIAISNLVGSGAPRYLTGGTVVGNVISGLMATSGGGIVIWGDSNTGRFDDFNVIGNTIHNIPYGHGLKALYASDVIVSNNIFKDIAVPTAPPNQTFLIHQEGRDSTQSYTGAHGILLWDCRRFSVSGNTLRNIGGDGIYVYGSQDSTFSDNKISKCGRNLATGEAAFLVNDHPYDPGIANAFTTGAAVGIAITDATNASPVVVTATGHTLSTGDWVKISGVTGNTEANGNWRVTVSDANTFSLDGSTGSGAYVSGGSIDNKLTLTTSGASNTMPIVIHTTGLHNYVTGDQVTIAGVQGNSAANGTWTITRIDTHSFSLDGSTGTGVYTAHGTSHNISREYSTAVIDGNDITDSHQYGLWISAHSNVKIMNTRLSGNTVNYLKDGTATAKLMFNNDWTGIAPGLGDTLQFDYGTGPQILSNSSRLRLRGGSSGTDVVNAANNRSLLFVQDNGTVFSRRFSNGGAFATSVTPENWSDPSLSGWGSTATVTTATGTDGGGLVEISSEGTGQTINPYILLTFVDGAWAAAPFPVVCWDGSSTGAAMPVGVSVNATQLEIFYYGTPVAGKTYRFRYTTKG